MMTMMMMMMMMTMMMMMIKDDDDDDGDDEFQKALAEFQEKKLIDVEYIDIDTVKMSYLAIQSIVKWLHTYIQINIQIYIHICIHIRIYQVMCTDVKVICSMREQWLGIIIMRIN